MNRQYAGVAVGAVALAVLLASGLLVRPPRPAALVLGGQLAAGYAFLLSTSGLVVTGALKYAGTSPIEEAVDTGRAVGKIENVLVMTLTLFGAFSAIAIVFTAKSIVRWQDLSSENTTYYLTGSIANVTYSFLVGIGVGVVLGVGHW